MNLTEAYRQIWEKKLEGAVSPYKQTINRVTWTAGLFPQLEGAALLDIGAGSGVMLCEAERRGWTAVGLEYDAPLVDWLREQGLDARRFDANSQNIPFPDASFDIVTCCDVIEHLIDPEFALREMRRVCGGRVYVSTANYSHWFRVVELARGSHRGTSGDHTLVDGGHLCYFGASDLAAMAERAGFKGAKTHFVNPNPAREPYREQLLSIGAQPLWMDHTYLIVEAVCA